MILNNYSVDTIFCGCGDFNHAITKYKLKNDKKRQYECIKIPLYVGNDNSWSNHGIDDKVNKHLISFVWMFGNAIIKLVNDNKTKKKISNIFSNITFDMEFYIKPIIFYPIRLIYNIEYFIFHKIIAYPSTILTKKDSIKIKKWGIQAPTVENEAGGYSIDLNIRILKRKFNLSKIIEFFIYGRIEHIFLLIENYNGNISQSVETY
jgi:hypothetical protein